MKSLKLIVVLIVLSVLVSYSKNASAELTARANHDHITIDFFYNGGTVSVRGISDPGTDLVIKFSSEDGHQVLRQKGKVGGLLWMTVGELKIEHTPNLYEVHSTRNLSDILNKNEMDKYSLGYTALQNRAEMNVSSQTDKEKWFSEYVRYKEAENLYTTSTGKISLNQTDGKQGYYILTEWPYQAPPGKYTVTVYAVKNGKVVETATSNILVEQVGIVKTLATMANDNGALYGIISIVAALAAGFGVGLVFRKSEGAH